MIDKPSMEIPTQVRELAEKNVEQTRAAYDQFLAMARQSQDLVMNAKGDAKNSALDVQAKAMRYNEQNVEAGFRFAADLARARDMTEYAQIQTLYAQTQALTLNQQTLDLARLVAEAAEKMKSGKP
jgi:hypothetical protein